MFMVPAPVMRRATEGLDETHGLRRCSGIAGDAAPAASDDQSGRTSGRKRRRGQAAARRDVPPKGRRWDIGVKDEFDRAGAEQIRRRRSGAMAGEEAGRVMAGLAGLALMMRRRDAVGLGDHALAGADHQREGRAVRRSGDHEPRRDKDLQGDGQQRRDQEDATPRSRTIAADPRHGRALNARSGGCRTPEPTDPLFASVGRRR